MSGRAQQAAQLLRDAETDPATPRRARHNLALAFAASGEEARAVRLLRLEMGPVEAETLTTEMRAFAGWLARTGPTRAAAAQQLLAETRAPIAAAPLGPVTPAAAPEPPRPAVTMEPISSPGDPGYRAAPRPARARAAPPAATR
jgi:hypothetical protein